MFEIVCLTLEANPKLESYCRPDYGLDCRPDGECPPDDGSDDPY